MRLNLVHDWDESRHSSCSYIYYTWIKEGFPNWKEFSYQFEQKIPGHFGFLTQIDPPFYSFVQGIIFLIASPNFVAARITTELLICFGALFLFLLASKILSSKLLGLCTVVLFLLSPISFELSGVSILAMPIAVFMVSWFYFTFYSSRILKIKYGEKIFNLNLSVVLGAVFLSCAVMMKYQNLIFVAVFGIIFLIYCLTKQKKDEALELVKIGAIQGFIFILLTGWWLYYIFSTGMMEKVWELGAGKEFLWTLSFITFYIRALFVKTGYLIGFSFVPLFFKKGRLFLKENIRLVILILSLLLTATIVVTHQQLRYVIFIVPLCYLLIVKGIDIVMEKFKIRYGTIAMIIILSVVCVYAGIHQINEREKVIGVQDYDISEFAKQQTPPRLFLYIHMPKNESTGYYTSPDEWLFQIMMVNDNPLQREIYARYFYWSSMTENYVEFFNLVDGWNNQVPTAVFIPKYRIGTQISEEELFKRNFTKTELRWYDVYQKSFNL